MKIHSSALTELDIWEAARFASRIGHGTVTIQKCAKYGSRSHGSAFDVTLSGDGSVNKRRVNAGTARYVDRFELPYAATWDSWGVFLAVLYKRDPKLKTPYYADAEDFHRRTENKFTDLKGLVVQS